jgi:hypothetical protein
VEYRGSSEHEPFHSLPLVDIDEGLDTHIQGHFGWTEPCQIENMKQ